MKNILFPTDFSENAQNAYTYALHFAKALGAKITTLHAYEEPRITSTPHLSNTIKDIMVQEREMEQKKYRDAAKKMHEQAANQDLGDVVVLHTLVEGDPIQIILEASKQNKCDLIIMGTKGASGFSEVFIGSKTAKVIEEAECPVLAIPDKATYHIIDKIAYTTNFDRLDEEMVKEAMTFADLFKAQTHVVHVNTEGNTNAYAKMEKLENCFLNDENVCFEVIEDDDVLEGMEEYINKNGIDVLAMLTHKRSFLDRLFGTSYTKKMAFHSDSPLLAFHD